MKTIVYLQDDFNTYSSSSYTNMEFMCIEGDTQMILNIYDAISGGDITTFWYLDKQLEVWGVTTKYKKEFLNSLELFDNIEVVRVVNELESARDFLQAIKKPQP